MGWLGKLFGSDKALESGAKIAEQATSGIISGIDKAWYTKEERAQDATKVLLSLQDQFTPRSISRRILAFSFCFCFCASFTISLVFACLDKTHIVNNIINLVKAYQLGWITVTIVVFYFGNYLVDKLKKK